MKEWSKKTISRKESKDKLRDLKEKNLNALLNEKFYDEIGNKIRSRSDSDKKEIKQLLYNDIRERGV